MPGEISPSFGQEPESDQASTEVAATEEITKKVQEIIRREAVTRDTTWEEVFGIKPTDNSRLYEVNVWHVLKGGTRVGARLNKVEGRYLFDIMPSAVAEYAKECAGTKSGKVTKFESSGVNSLYIEIDENED